MGSNQTPYGFSTNALTFNGSTGILTSPNYVANGSIASAASAGAFSYGTLNYTDTNIFASFQASVNTYAQMILQNTSTGTQASADFIVSSNSGTSVTNYGDFGINGSGFSSTGGFAAPNETYLYSTGGDLAIGTFSSNSIHFVIGNSTTDAMTINTSGAVAFNGTYGTSGYVLTTQGSGYAPTWTSSNAGSVSVSNSTATTNYLVLVTGVSGSQPVYTNTGITYNGTTNAVTAGINGGVF